MSSNTWTQDAIGGWGEDTFGRPSNALDLVDRALDEYHELWELTHITDGFDLSTKEEQFVDIEEVMEEMADVVIIFKQIAYYLSSDLDAAVAKKMVKNLKRKWVKTGDGVGRHIEI